MARIGARKEPGRCRVGRGRGRWRRGCQRQEGAAAAAAAVGDQAIRPSRWTEMSRVSRGPLPPESMRRASVLGSQSAFEAGSRPARCQLRFRVDLCTRRAAYAQEKKPEHKQGVSMILQSVRYTTGRPVGSKDALSRTRRFARGPNFDASKRFPLSSLAGSLPRGAQSVSSTRENETTRLAAFRVAPA